MPDPAPPSLRTYQAWMADALLDPDQAAPDGYFEGPSARVAAGLDIYRNNVTVSLIDSLADIFPAVQALVGTRFFRGLAREFLRAHPPQEARLAAYGKALPDFIAAFPPAAQLPYLADVARVELTWLAAYHAADAAPLPAERWAAEDPDGLLGKRVTLHPSLDWVESRFPVTAIFEANRSDGDHPEIDLTAGPETALVLRPDWSVNVLAAPVGMGAFLSQLTAGATLAESLASFDQPDTAQHALTLLIQSQAVTRLA